MPQVAPSRKWKRQHRMRENTCKLSKGFVSGIYKEH